MHSYLPAYMSLVSTNTALMAPTVFTRPSVPRLSVENRAERPSHMHVPARPPCSMPRRPFAGNDVISCCLRPSTELLSTTGWHGMCQQGIVLSHLVLATGSHQHQPMLRASRHVACQPACQPGGACLPALRASQYSVPASVPASLYQQDQLAFRLLYDSLTSSLPEVIIQVILLIHCPR